MTSIQNERSLIEPLNEPLPEETLKKVVRGEIYTCEFPKGTGSEQHKDRPAIIIQNNIGNIHSPTTIIAVITTKKYGSKYPMHINIPKSKNTLEKNSTIMVEQIYTVDKSRLKEKLADISTNKVLMEKLDKSIAISLGVSV
jgi:mRNA interferase MazF